MIRVAETLLDGNELEYVTRAVKDNWISSAGRWVREFEARFAEVTGCRHAIACSSGTAALHLAAAATGIGPGDEVIVPTFTMIATANAARYVGADPVLVDADPASWNLDVSRLRAKLTRRTRAVIAVHLYGQPADMDGVHAFAERNGLIVIEDAAEAHGATYRGAPAGSLGDVGVFSLYGNKILTAGEGGVVTTNDERIATVARELRDHAFSAERHFWHRRLGFNYRMTNLQAAVAFAQVQRLDELVARRQSNATRYREALGGIDGITLGPQLDGGVCWMFSLLVDEQRFGIDRDQLREHLAARGVETRTLFVPMHLQPIYQQRFAGQRYPVAERLGATGLYLPSGPSLTDDDIAYVAERRAFGGTLRARRQPELGVELAEVRREHGRREPPLERRPRVLAEARSELWLLDQLTDRPRERPSVAGRDQHRVVPVGDVLGQAVDVGDDRRDPRLECLEQRHRAAALLERGQHEHVGGAEVRHRVGDTAGDEHPILESDSAHKLAMGTQQHTGADKAGAKRRPLIAEQRERADQRVKPLAAVVAADRHDQRRLGVAESAQWLRVGRREPRREARRGTPSPGCRPAAGSAARTRSAR